MTPFSESQTDKMRLLGQMAGGVTHDFNNLLSVIGGYTQILQQNCTDPGILEKLDAIALATQRGTALTRRVMDFGQNAPLALQQCDLAQIIRDDQILLRPILGSRIDLLLRLPQSPLLVACDADSVSRILVNLALHARRRIAQTGWVRIDGEVEEGQVVLSFSDSSDAPPPDAEPHGPMGQIAQILRQAKGSLHHAQRPALLGPPVNVFLLGFPPPPASAAPLFAKTGCLKKFEDKTILIVDDEEALLPVLENQLGRLGLKVLKAANADSALLLQENYPGIIDFLLTDLAMPGVDGVELAERMTGQRPKIGVVYMTGFIGRPDILDQLPPLPDHALILPKPLRPEALSSILQQALEDMDKL